MSKRDECAADESAAEAPPAKRARVDGEEAPAPSSAAAAAAAAPRVFSREEAQAIARASSAENTRGAAAADGAGASSPSTRGRLAGGAAAADSSPAAHSSRLLITPAQDQMVECRAWGELKRCGNFTE